MNCMKCGRELESEQAFCEDCLLEMKNYPVNPNTIVQLPRRKEAPPVRKSPNRRRTVSPEEQVKSLKKRLWILTGILVVVLVILISMIYPTVNYFVRNYYLRPGQNYSTITVVETTDPFEGIAE